MDGVTGVLAGVVNVVENVVMGVLEPAADTETTTAVVVANARCSCRAIARV
jgi:hypothetical protein